MTALAIVAGWWAFLALVGVSVCRAAGKPRPPVSRASVEVVDLAGIEWDWKRP